MTIAADTCIYTNHNFTIETMASKPPPKEEGEGVEAAAEPGTGGADAAGSAAAVAAAAETEAAAERAAAPTSV
jgi:hypothetical protein